MLVNVSCSHGMMDRQHLFCTMQDGVTAITWACQNGHVHVVKELVQANVNVNQRNKVNACYHQYVVVNQKVHLSAHIYFLCCTEC